MSTTTENQLAGLFRQSRTVWAIRAAAALIIGILVLVWPQATVSILAILLGIYFVILGVVRVVQGFVDKDLNGGGKAANFIIGALIYIFSRLVGQIMRGEPIDFLPMLRPFLIVMLIALVPSLCNVIDDLGNRLVMSSEVGNRFAVRT